MKRWNYVVAAVAVASIWHVHEAGTGMRATNEHYEGPRVGTRRWPATSPLHWPGHLRQSIRGTDHASARVRIRRHGSGAFRQHRRLHEEEEIEVSPRLHQLIVQGMLSLLIFISICFEIVKDWILESSSKEMKPIITCLFSELTVLGFLSLVSFAIVNSGIMKVIARFTIPQAGEEGEEFYMEMFEQVHLTLFLVMVVFIVIVVALLKLGNQTKDHWKAAAIEVTQDPNQVREKYRNMKADKKPFEFFDPREAEYAKVNHRMEFLSLRSEFINPRDQRQQKLPPDFAYHTYLSLLLGETIATTVDIPVSTWFTLECTAIIYFLLLTAAGASSQATLILWPAFGYILYAIQYVTDKKIQWIRKQMVDKKYYTFTDKNGEISGGPKSDEISPAFLARTATPRKWWQKHLLGPELPNSQELLFWLDRQGPTFIFFLVRQVVLMISIYLSLLLLHVLHDAKELMWNDPKGEVMQDVGKPLFVLYTLICCGPLYAVYKYMPLIIRRGVHVSNIEMMKDHDKIQTVQSIMRAEKSARAAKLLDMMHARANLLGAKNALQEDAELTPEDLKQIMGNDELYEKIHQMIEDLVGEELEMEAHHLKKLMDMLGKREIATNEEAQNMINQIDDDGNGTVSEAEFVVWWTHEYNSDQKCSTKHLVESMFGSLDLNGDGNVTRDVFEKELSKRFSNEGCGDDNGLTNEEIGLLLVELDEDNDRNISLEEFTKFIEKYAN